MPGLIASISAARAPLPELWVALIEIASKGMVLPPVIIATLFAFSHLSFRYDDDELAEGYGRLYEHAANHPEAAAIFQAID